MQEIIGQIGGLLLSAVPTMVLFIVLVLAYQFLVQGPLSRTLRERRARTEGAIEDAHKAIGQAEARAAESADRLRQARAEVYKAREQRRVGGRGG
jgi:F-type H+-transporting ATPase subunit b